MRIVAGRWRGRRLAAPAGRHTRPTGDRVREGVFDALSARLGSFEDVAVLDVFAGTGSLGLEALSRGAARAVFVEKAAAPLAALAANIASLDAGDAARVVAADARGPGLDSALALGPFSLLLLDPPYRIDQAVAASVLRRCSPTLTIDALVVWEHAASCEAPDVPGWRTSRTYRYGDTAVTILDRDEGGVGA